MTRNGTWRSGWTVAGPALLVLALATLAAALAAGALLSGFFVSAGFDSPPSLASGFDERLAPDGDL